MQIKYLLILLILKSYLLAVWRKAGNFIKFF